jgi:hypothetical protein
VFWKVAMIPPVSALGRPLPCRQIVDRQDDQIGDPFERPRLPVSRSACRTSPVASRCRTFR